MSLRSSAPQLAPAFLDDAKVLWVNDFDPEENKQLMAHCPDHRHWLLVNTTSEKSQALGSDDAPIPEGVLGFHNP